jgi:type IV pilus assembly protein PilE
MLMTSGVLLGRSQENLNSRGATSMKRQSGFTLLELMIVVVVIAILSAIALPSYSDYVIRSRLTEAYTAMSTAQASAEQFWSNNRTYVGLNSAAGWPANTSNFTYNLSNQTASTYTITATGVTSSSVKGFSFTIDQNGNKTTATVPTGWTTSTTCWIYKKGGVCVQ